MKRYVLRNTCTNLLRIESISESDVMKFEQIDALHQIVEGNADIVLISTSAALRK